MCLHAHMGCDTHHANVAVTGWWSDPEGWGTELRIGTRGAEQKM